MGLKLLRDQQPTIELVRSGTSPSKISSGAEIASGIFQEEYLDDLKFYKRAKTIQRMVFDPAIHGHLGFFKYPLQEADWIVEAATDDPQDVKIAKVVRANLYRQGERSYWTMNPWRQRLNEILTGLNEWGFCMFYKERALMKGSLGTFQCFRRLVFIHPRTIVEWDVESGDVIKGIVREYIDPTGEYVSGEYLPARDLALFTRDIVGNFYEGRSLIRPLYRPWKLKDVAERVEAVDLTRRGTAVPYGRLSPRPKKREREDMEKAVKMMRGEAQEYAWVLIGQDNELGFIEPKAEVRDSLPVVQRKTLDMAQAVGNIFMQLGTTQSGSRAIAEVQMDVAMLPVNAQGKWIAEMETNGLGGLPGFVQELVEMNWPDVKEGPKVIPRRVNPREHRSTVPDMVTALKEEGVMPKDPEIRAPLQKELVERLGFEVPTKLKQWVLDPTKIPDEERPQIPQPSDFGGNDGEGDDGKKRDPVKEQSRYLESIRKYAIRALEKAGVRLPKHMTLALLDERTLRDSVKRIMDAEEGSNVIDIDSRPGGDGSSPFFVTRHRSNRGSFS